MHRASRHDSLSFVGGCCGGLVQAATDDSYIYMSTNFGAHWVRLSSLGSAVWQDVAMSSDGSTLTVAEYGGRVWRCVWSGQTTRARLSVGLAGWLVID